MTVARAPTFHGQTVTVSFIVATPSYTWRGLTVVGAAEPGDNSERAAFLKGTRNDIKEGTRITATGNLAVLYAQTAWGISDRLGIDLYEARELLRQHARLFSTYHEWSKRVVATANLRRSIAKGTRKGPGAMGYKEVAAAWAAKNRSRTAATQKALAAAEDKFSLMLDSFASLRAGPAKEALRVKVEAQEEVVEGLRAGVVPLGERLARSRELVLRCREQLGEVRQALVGEDGAGLKRRNAVVLSRVVRRLTVFFRAEDRGAGQERSVPELVEVLPVTGEAASYGADVPSPTPGRQSWGENILTGLYPLAAR